MHVPKSTSSSNFSLESIFAKISLLPAWSGATILMLTGILLKNAEGGRAGGRGEGQVGVGM